MSRPAWKVEGCTCAAPPDPAYYIGAAVYATLVNSKKMAPDGRVRCAGTSTTGRRCRQYGADSVDGRNDYGSIQVRPALWWTICPVHLGVTVRTTLMVDRWRCPLHRDQPPLR